MQSNYQHKIRHTVVYTILALIISVLFFSIVPPMVGGAKSKKETTCDDVIKITQENNELIKETNAKLRQHVKGEGK